MSGSDILILVAIVVLVLLLIILAIAETGLNRISRVKAQAIDENTRSKSSAALRGLVEQPARFINPLLVTVTHGELLDQLDHLGIGRRLARLGVVRVVLRLVLVADGLRAQRRRRVSLSASGRGQ